MRPPSASAGGGRLRVGGKFPLDTFADPWHCGRHTKGDTVTTLIRTLICSAAAMLTTAWAGNGLGLGMSVLIPTAALICAAYLGLWAWVEGEVAQ